MIDPDTIECPASDLREGDMVDLKSIPATADHPSADYELAWFLSAEPDGDNLLVSLEGVEPVVVLKPTDVVRVRRE